MLYLGYERAIIATLEDSSHELLESLQEACYSDTYTDSTDEFQAWWDKLVHPLEPDDDPLFELPKWTDPIENQSPAKTSFMTQTPFFTQLGNSISSCNIHSCSTFLTLIEEALLPLSESVIQDYNLPSPQSIPSLHLLQRPHHSSLGPLGPYGQNQLLYGPGLLSDHPSLGYPSN